jgi:hypothetical protein
VFAARKRAKLEGVNGHVSPEELKRRARAAWAYSLKGQEELNVDQVPYNTLRGLLSPNGPNPSVEQAWAIADACGVPRDFMLTGHLRPPAPPLEEVVAQLLQAVTSLASGEAESALLEAAEAAEQLRGGTARGGDAPDRQLPSQEDGDQ